MKLVEPSQPLIPVSHQCALLQVNRAWYYDWRSRGGELVSAEDQAVMNWLDEVYTRTPFYGVRRIGQQLRREGLIVNHKRVHRLMRVLGIAAIYPKPKLSRAQPDHPVYPYLLRGLTIDHPGQVYGTDITYIRLKNDWLYLTAVMDWYSRRVLAWELSDSLAPDFCVTALEKALAIRIPEIHNSDQGVQFTGEAYLNVLRRYPIRISLDGRGRAFDNIFVERLWRSVKYEEVYLKDYQSPREARQSLGEYFSFYNRERPHQSLNYLTPEEVFYGRISQKLKETVRIGGEQEV